MNSNLQGSDLNPIEEAKAYKSLKDSGMTAVEIAAQLGKSAGFVTTRLKLLEFDPTIQELFKLRKLPLDTTIIYGLFKLPEELRTTTAVKYAIEGTSLIQIRESLCMIIKDLESNMDRSLTESRSAQAGTIISGWENAKIFMILGKHSINTPEWQPVNVSASEACQDCELADLASDLTCKDCPAIDLLKRLKAHVTQREKVHA